MTPSRVQSESEPRYFDPEEADMSEQQFAASLDASPEKPQFDIDEADGECLLSGTLAPKFIAVPEALPLPVMEGPQSAPVVSASPRSEPGTDSCSNTQADQEPDWRRMVSAKVSSYKARRPHQERYPSLRLEFDAPPPRVSRQLQAFASVEEAGPAVEQGADAAEAKDQTVFVSPPLPDPPTRIVMEATARVIEFPRPAARSDELAEPVIDRPRIVEAPELLPPPPAMGGILIEEQRETEPERRPGFDVPLASASLNRRVAAGLCDGALVLAAVALFGYVSIRITGAMPPLGLTAGLSVCLLGVLWPAYQYAFLVYCGKTPGLRAVKLHLARFDGQPASRGLRRWRVLASVLSLVSLGLGYAWCFLDEDQLSWHDRITRTHLAPNDLAGACESAKAGQQDLRTSRSPGFGPDRSRAAGSAESLASANIFL
jgi:uncharacterized RDD family membrane protein YckC